MPAGFTFSSIFIVASLEPHEFKSGKHLRDYVEAQARAHVNGLQIEFVTVGHRKEFLSLLETLCERAYRGERPLLHVDCHGDPERGLEFANGSELAWPELSTALERLNRATGLNLLTICSACFGAHFATQHVPTGGTPCYQLVAPTAKIDPGEALGHFRTFYATLFEERDAGRATLALIKQSPSEGSWFWLLAELWFVVVGRQYMESQCTWEQMLKRANENRSRVPGHGRPGMVRMLRLIRAANRRSLEHEFFSKFFMVESLPESAQRFRDAQERLDDVVNELRRTGRYCL